MRPCKTGCRRLSPPAAAVARGAEGASDDWKKQAQAVSGAWSLPNATEGGSRPAAFEGSDAAALAVSVSQPMDV